VRGNSGKRARRREALVQALHSGEKVPLWGPPRAWGMVLGALMALGAFAFEVWLQLSAGLRYPRDVASLLLPAGVFVELAYEWGKAKHHGIRLGERHMETWDWRGRSRLLAYDEIQAVRTRRYFLSSILSVYRTAEDGGAAWRQIVSYSRTGKWLVMAAANELVRRCKLVERADGFWVRSPADDVPEPVASWE